MNLFIFKGSLFIMNKKKILKSNPIFSIIIIAVILFGSIISLLFLNNLFFTNNDDLPINYSSNIIWNQTFGGLMDDKSYDVISTVDGGFAFSGHYTHFDPDEPVTMDWNLRKMNLIITDIDGNIQENHIYGRNFSHSAAYTSIRCKDDGYILAGYETININADAYVVKTNKSGHLEWSNYYGGFYQERVFSIIQTSDDGFLLTGFSDSYEWVGDSLYILKLDNNGNEEWHQIYGGISEEEFEWGYCVIETNDGNYAISGYTSTYGQYWAQLGKADLWLVKIDNYGEILWNKTYGFEGVDRGLSLIQSTNGDFVIAGYSDKYNNVLTEDIYVIRTDAQGNIIWNKTYGGEGSDQANTVIEVENGDLLLSGYTSTLNNSREGFIMKLNSEGNHIWNFSIGGEKDDEFTSFIISNDGDFVFSGFTESYGNGMNDMWFVKVRIGIIKE